MRDASLLRRVGAALAALGAAAFVLRVAWRVANGGWNDVYVSARLIRLSYGGVAIIGVTLVVAALLGLLARWLYFRRESREIRRIVDDGE